MKKLLTKFQRISVEIIFPTKGVFNLFYQNKQLKHFAKENISFTAIYVV